MHSLSITKNVELKKKIDLHGIRTYIHQSRVGGVTTTAHWTINFIINKCSIYYQLCLGCGLQECRRSFSKNRLHPGIQSAVDGERLRLRRYKNKLRVPRRRALHFEQVWHGSWRRSTRPKKCGWTDGQTDGFSALYSRLCITYYGALYKWWRRMAATEHGTVIEGCCFTFIASLFCESAEQKAERPRKTQRFVVFVAALTFLTANHKTLNKNFAAPSLWCHLKIVVLYKFRKL